MELCCTIVEFSQALVHGVAGVVQLGAAFGQGVCPLADLANRFYVGVGTAGQLGTAAGKLVQAGLQLADAAAKLAHEDPGDRTGHALHHGRGVVLQRFAHGHAYCAQYGLLLLHGKASRRQGGQQIRIGHGIRYHGRAIIGNYRRQLLVQLGHHLVIAARIAGGHPPDGSADRTQTVPQGVGTVHQGRAAVIQLGQAVGQGFGTLVQALHAVGVLVEAIIQCLHAVGQSAGTVRQFVGGVGQVVQRVTQIVQVGQVAGVQIIQRRGSQDRGRKVQREVGHIGAHFKISGNLGVLQRLKLGQAQAVRQAWHRGAQHGRCAVQLHNLAVVGLNIRELVPVQNHRCDGRKRHADRVLLPIHRDGLAGVVGVVKADAHPAALPGQVSGGGFHVV